jgi:drug/metabolite transporter (DMT)-like permease
MYVPLVPLLQWLVLRRPPRLMHWVGILLAFVGLLLLAGPQGGDGLEAGLSTGHWITIFSTLPIAAEILLIGHFAGATGAAGKKRVDTRRVTVVQLLVAGSLSLLLMPVAGETLPSFSWVWLVAAMGLGLASALIQWTMNWAQRTVPPTRATLIYAGEPVWGGVVGRLAGERLPGLALLGGAFIVLSVIVSELKLTLSTKATARQRLQVEAEAPVQASRQE